MTLIAFVAKRDSALIMTDSVSYTANASQLSLATKVLPMAHLDAAVLAQGDQLYGWGAKVSALAWSGSVSSFDQLAAESAQWLPPWDEAEQHRDAGVTLVGYSPQAERFIAWQYDSANGFTPERIEGMYCYPATFTMRPSAYEKRRQHHLLDPYPDEIDRAKVAGALDTWNTKPATLVPRTPEAWVQLAVDIRRQRALEQWDKVIVAGDVFLTELGRGTLSTRRIHSYDDAGEEFQQLVRGTAHPQGQLGACPCNSGRTYLACCLADHLDDPCDCLSGRTMRECCMVAVDGNESAVL